MNNTIYKYPLKVTDSQAVPLPAGAVILAVQFQGEQLCLWAAVKDSERSIEPQTVLIFGTGHPVEDFGLLRYVSTVQQMCGALVWHVFVQQRTPIS